MNRRHWIASTCILATLAVTGYLSFMGSRALRTSMQGSTGIPETRVDRRNTEAPGNHSVPARAKMTRAASSGGSAAAWTKRFYSSNNYLRFVKDALPAAMRGNGRAAFFIGKALASCAWVIQNYQHSADPYAQLQQELESEPNAPQWARDLQEKKTRRCLGLVHRDPFKLLPPRQGGYSYSYWFAQGLADGDPLAQVQAAANALAKISVTSSMPGSEKRRLVDLAAKNLRVAVESGDPNALYDAGLLLAENAGVSRNPLSGIAVTLAACDLGYDCSAANPEAVFSGCRLSGACPADADWSYFLQKSLGPAKYAQVYANARQIEYSVKAGNWNAVMGSLALNNVH